MSIRCQCPLCQTVISIYEKAIGHRIRCPACQKLIEAVPLQNLAAQPAVPQSPSLQELLPVLGESPESAAEPLAPPIVAVATSYPAPSASSVTAPGGMVAVSNSRKPIIFREKRKGEEAEMDMTPMVDVVFQLLIFFMLTASFTMQKSLNVPKPQQDEASTQAQSIEDFQNNPDYVVVRIDAVNTFHVSTAAWADEVEAPSEQELLVKLRQARQGDSQGNIPSKLLVIANGEALHERVVTAIDSGNDVGMDEVQLLTVEEDEG